MHPRDIFVPPYDLTVLVEHKVESPKHLEFPTPPTTNTEHVCVRDQCVLCFRLVLETGPTVVGDDEIHNLLPQLRGQQDEPKNDVPKQKAFVLVEAQKQQQQFPHPLVGRIIFMDLVLVGALEDHHDEKEDESIFLHSVEKKNIHDTKMDRYTFDNEGFADFYFRAMNCLLPNIIIKREGSTVTCDQYFHFVSDEQAIALQHGEDIVCYTLNNEIFLDDVQDPVIQTYPHTHIFLRDVGSLVLRPYSTDITYADDLYVDRDLIDVLGARTSIEMYLSFALERIENFLVQVTKHGHH